MLHTLIIPVIVGFVCFVIAAVILNITMPLVPIDDGIKGIIKILVWIISFALPSEYLRKKAKKKIASEAQ